MNRITNYLMVVCAALSLVACGAEQVATQTNAQASSETLVGSQMKINMTYYMDPDGKYYDKLERGLFMIGVVDQIAGDQARLNPQYFACMDQNWVKTDFINSPPPAYGFRLFPTAQYVPIDLLESVEQEIRDALRQSNC